MKSHNFYYHPDLVHLKNQLLLSQKPCFLFCINTPLLGHKEKLDSPNVCISFEKRFTFGNPVDGPGGLS